MFIWLRTLNKFRLKRKLIDNNNKRCIYIRSSKRNSLLLWIWGYESSFIFGSINFYNNCNCEFLTSHRIKNQDIMVKSATQFQNKKKKECIGKIYRNKLCSMIFVMGIKINWLRTWTRIALKLRIKAGITEKLEKQVFVQVWNWIIFT